MGKMDRDTLGSLLRNMEEQAQTALANDASFFEALRALKREVDSDARVRAAIRVLSARGLSVFSSFAPRVRIRLYTGETVLALPRQTAGFSGPVSENFDVTHTESEAKTQELRNAASAVIAASSCCRELDIIVNEAVRAHAGFERIASALERAGYQLQICLDLSTYAQLGGRRASALPSAGQQSVSSDDAFHSELSKQDVIFLRELRISTG
jgi:hypothetical protein